MDSSGVFMPCDVRGKYPEAVNERLFRAIGGALAELHPGATVFLAGDLRASTPSLVGALESGLPSTGMTIIYPLATPVAYFVARELDAGLTLVVTASHNPPAYNGLKVLGQGGRPPTGAQWRALQTRSTTLLGTAAAPAGRDPPGPVSAGPWLERYSERLAGLAGHGRPLRVVVDPGNGCLSGLAAEVLRRAGHEVTEINGRPDGSFPARGPDPTAAGALGRLSSEVARSRAHLGAAFDGDGDRAVFVDESGATVPGDVAAGLLALDALETRPRAPVILDVRSSRRLAAAVAARGAVVVWSYPGHAILRAQLLDRNAAFGGEISGHYFFAELGGDDGLYAALRLARLVAREGPLSALAGALPRGHTLAEVRLPFEGEADRVLDALSAAFPDAVAERRPAGLVLEWDGEWALVRPSITEPLLTVRGESSSETGLRLLTARIDGVLRQFGLRLE